MKELLTKPERKRRYRALRIKLYCFFGLVGAALIFAAYAALNFSAFKIKTITASGSADLGTARAAILRDKWAQLLGFKNFLSWPRQVGDWTVSKDYSTGTLTLSGEKPRQYAVWCFQDCYWVDEKGIVGDKAPDTEGGSILKINDSRTTPPVAGEPVLAGGDFANILKAVQGLSGLPIQVNSYGYNGKLQELTALGSKGEKLIFSARFAPADKLFGSLGELIQKGKLKNSQYVDLTVENRIYLK